MAHENLSGEKAQAEAYRAASSLQGEVSGRRFRVEVV